MVERIKEIILKEGLTSGSFADLVGVQRSSMSHILNGRNNPSLDFVVKTLQAFPKLNPEWLLTGVGAMYRTDESAQSRKSVREQRSIFDQAQEAAPAQPIEAPAEPVTPPVQTVVAAPEPVVPPAPRPVSTPETVPTPEIKPIQKSEPAQKTIDKQPVSLNIPQRYVNKVFIFYSDHTYDEFLKAEQAEN